MQHSTEGPWNGHCVGSIVNKSKAIEVRGVCTGPWKVGEGDCVMGSYVHHRIITKEKVVKQV